MKKIAVSALAFMLGLWCSTCPAAVKIHAPDFTLTSMDGQQVSLSQYDGRKVILYFFSAKFPVCQAGLQVMNDFVSDVPPEPADNGEAQETKESKAKTTAVLCITEDPSLKDVQQCLDKLGVHGVTVVQDRLGQVKLRYSAAGLPTTILINEGGEIVWKKTGQITNDDLNVATGRAEPKPTVPLAQRNRKNNNNNSDTGNTTAKTHKTGQ